MPASLWNRFWNLAIDPDRARRVIDELRVHRDSSRFLASIRPDSASALVQLAGGSSYLSSVLLREPAWVQPCFRPEALGHARRAEGLRTEAGAFLDEAIGRADHAAALVALRRFREKESLRIAARDLSRSDSVEIITRELSDLADVCLAGTYRIVRAQLASRHGEPWHRTQQGTWTPTPFCILGLGKLGGQELNFSSDVDLMFVYGDEGFVFRDPPSARAEPRSGAMPNHQFFRRLAELFGIEVARIAPEGQLYRIDLRLRPEGDSGPLARSLDSYETYYAEWGQTWERLMLLKARPIVGDRQLGSEFLETIQPFRHPRFLSDGLLDEIAATKTRLETEAVQGNSERDVKRGRGGIREIEFIAQSLQLLNAGKQPFLQSTATLPTLAKLTEYGLLSKSDSSRLAEAYRFWRDVEHRLQMDENRQTHALPNDDNGLRRIAKLMGCVNAAEFEQKRLFHAERVRNIYDRFLGNRTPTDPAPDLPPTSRAHEKEWCERLRVHGFGDPPLAARRVRELVEGPGWSHVSRRTGQLGRALLPLLLAACPGGARPRPAPGRVSGVLSDPDYVLARLERFIQAYGSRPTLYETWSANPQFFELLLWLLDRSEFLGEVAIRTPDLIEEILAGGHLRRSRSRDEQLADLRHGRGDADQARWMRRYHQAEQLRIGLRSILELADPAQTQTELTTLAEACLAYALEVIQHRHRLRSAPFSLIGLGKLGGAELTFGSDLDLIFLVRDRQRELDRSIRLATEFIALLSGASDLGCVYALDARLRPDGEKGLIVNTESACIEYYRRRARLWEIQALTRARHVAGDATTAKRFLDSVTPLTHFKDGNPGVAAWDPAWSGAIDRMLERIHAERTPAGCDDLAFKTGTGGLVAAEFLGQKWALADGFHEPNTRQALARGIANGHVTIDAGEALLRAVDSLRRIELIVRRWSGSADALLPKDPHRLDRVAIRCGFRDGQALMEESRRARQIIRSSAHLEARGRP